MICGFLIVWFLMGGIQVHFKFVPLMEVLGLAPFTAVYHHTLKTGSGDFPGWWRGGGGEKSSAVVNCSLPTATLHVTSAAGLLSYYL